MGKNVQKILGMINTDIGGVNFQVEGQLVRFHFDQKSKVYTIYSGGKLQTISLNELLTVLNSPLMEQPMAEKIQEMEEEKARIEEIQQQSKNKVLIPLKVSIVIVFFLTLPLSYKYFATHLIAFPHIFPSVPSALNILIKASAVSE